MATEKCMKIYRFSGAIEGCCESVSFRLAADQKTVNKILDLLKANGLDPEAVASEMRKLLGEDDFAFVEGFRPQRGDDRFANWKRIHYEFFLFACYRVWPD